MYDKKMIFLDYDGVLVNFTQQCIDTFGLNITNKDITHYHAIREFLPDMDKKISEVRT